MGGIKFLKYVQGDETIFKIFAQFQVAEFTYTLLEYHFRGKNCTVDIDECQKETNCIHGNCTNMPGTYRCHCEKGWFFVLIKNFYTSTLMSNYQNDLQKIKYGVTLRNLLETLPFSVSGPNFRLHRSSLLHFGSMSTKRAKFDGTFMCARRLCESTGEVGRKWTRDGHA